MAKFKKKTQTSQQISTASLPDIVFMLLFFFMVSTVLREVDLLVLNRVPAASEIQKLEKKTLVSYIYVGKPKDAARFGKENRIQLNDALATPDEIVNFVMLEKSNMPESDRDKMTISLKVDSEAKMGIITDVKTKLRECNALKVNYSAVKG